MSQTKTNNSAGRLTHRISAMSDPAAEVAIHAATNTLVLPTVRELAGSLADAVAKLRLSHKAFLAEILAAECDERDAKRLMRRVNEAKFPRHHTAARLPLHSGARPATGDVRQHVDPPCAPWYPLVSSSMFGAYCLYVLLLSRHADPF